MPPTPAPEAPPETVSAIADTLPAEDSGVRDRTPESDDTPESDASPEDEGRAGNSEAARYRTRLRETETERDALTARVERLQRADVTRQVGDRLAVPDDLFAFGLKLADLLNEDGEVEDGLVETALFALLDARPGLAKVAPRSIGPSSVGAGVREGMGAGNATWADVLRKR